MADEKKKFDQVAYNNAFNAKKYDRVTVMLPKGKHPDVKAHAEQRGESTNAFINRAIDETMARDNQTESGEP
ncbi:MAG: hypothetical protein IJW30_04125 [Clostridia bacterium]|nr:hypothetical protein [Clostridia bacterium]